MKRLSLNALAAAVLCLGCVDLYAAPGVETLAEDIFDKTGFRGGLIVHVDCNDGRLTAALKVNDSTIVHGLDDSAADVAAARARIREAGR